MSQGDALSTLTKFSADLNEIEKKSKSSELHIQIKHREKVEPLFQERQKALQEIPNFWSGVLGSAETPLAQFMNGTFDNKITRAVTDFEVKTAVRDGKLFHKILITFKSNVMLEAGTVFRELDSDGNTVSQEPIQWKNGTENLRKNSLFAFFNKDEEETDQDFIDDVGKAFDIVFQDPFVATLPDE